MLSRLCQACVLSEKGRLERYAAKPAAPVGVSRSSGLRMLRGLSCATSKTTGSTSFATAPSAPLSPPTSQSSASSLPSPYWHSAVVLYPSARHSSEVKNPAPPVWRQTHANTPPLAPSSLPSVIHHCYCIIDCHSLSIICLILCFARLRLLICDVLLSRNSWMNGLTLH